MNGTIKENQKNSSDFLIRTLIQDNSDINATEEWSRCGETG